MSDTFTPAPLIGEDFSNAGAGLASPATFGQYLGRDLFGTSQDLGLALMQGAAALPQVAVPGQAYEPDPVALDKAVQQQQAERQSQINVANDISTRYEGGLLPRLGADAIAGMIDPVNIAASIIPGIGEERIAALTGLDAGSFLTRAAAGASAGVAGQAPLELLRAAEDPDWRATDIVPDMTGGALLGALAHTGIGLLGDRLRGSPAPDAATDAAATRAAVAQVLTDSPVEVRPVLGDPAELGDALRTAAGAVPPDEAPGVEAAAAAPGLAPPDLTSEIGNLQAKLGALALPDADAAELADTMAQHDAGLAEVQRMQAAGLCAV